MAEQVGGLPFWKRCAIEFEMSIRFDRPLFEFDGTINEKTKYKHQFAFWWPWLSVTILGFNVGIGMFIGKWRIDG